MTDGTCNVAIKEHCCPTCGVLFWLSATYEGRRRSDGLTFYCPNGHSLSYGETETDRLLKGIAAIQTRLDARGRELVEARAELKACQRRKAKPRKHIRKRGVNHERA